MSEPTHDPPERDDAQDDERRLEDNERPGPRRDADEVTQSDAGLVGGPAEADRGERVGAEDDAPPPERR